MDSQARDARRRLTIEAHARLTDELGTGRPPTAGQVAERLRISRDAARHRCLTYGLPLWVEGPRAGPGSFLDKRAGEPPPQRLRICRARASRLAREGDLPLSAKYLRKLDSSIDEWRRKVPRGLI